MYQLTATAAFVRRVEDGALIPNDARNLDWHAFVQWRDGWTETFPDGTQVVHAPNAPLPADAAIVTQDDLDVAAARAYAKLNALKAMTPAQVQAWVAANVTNLAQAQDAIATLAVAVGILARRL